MHTCLNLQLLRISTLALCCMLACGLSAAGTGSSDDALRVRGGVRHVRVDEGSAAWDGANWQHEQRSTTSPCFATFTREGKPREVAAVQSRHIVCEAYIYNDRGQETRYTKLVDNLPIIQRVTRYHPRGAIAARDETALAGNGASRLTPTSAYRYDAQGREIVSRFYAVDGHPSSTELTSYTPHGLPRAEQVYGSNGLLAGETRYRYDAHDHLLVREVLDAHGTARERTVTDYDGAGREVLSTGYRRQTAPAYLRRTRYAGGQRIVEAFDAAGLPAPRRRTRTVYDADGRLVEETAYRYQDDGTPRSRTVTRYDANGHAVEEAMYDGAALPATRHVAEYDANGNVTREADYAWSFLGSETRWSYRYDRRGNWVKRYRRQWQRGAAENTAQSCPLTFRTITYWDDAWGGLPVFTDAMIIHPDMRARVERYTGAAALALLVILIIRWRRRQR